MNLEIFLFNGYGYFVWPAFIFTFLSCLFLYIKTKKELKKQEKIFLRHFKVIETIKVEKVFCSNTQLNLNDEIDIQISGMAVFFRDFVNILIKSSIISILVSIFVIFIISFVVNLIHIVDTTIGINNLELNLCNNL